MRVLAAFLVVCASAANAQDGTILGVSGVEYTRQEMLFEPPGAYDAARRLVRLRFVAPQIADQSVFGFSVIEPDFQILCEREGLPIVADFAPNAGQVVVSVASIALPFGETAPNVVQYFDLFRIENSNCIWEGI